MASGVCALASALSCWRFRDGQKVSTSSTLSNTITYCLFVLSCSQSLISCSTFAVGRPSQQLQPLCDVSVRFLEPDARAGVHLEDERLRGCIANAVGVLYGELRLAMVC